MNTTTDMTTSKPHGAMPELPVVAYGYENTRPTEKSALMTVALSNADDQYPELAVPLVRLSDARAAITDLTQNLEDMTADYMRRHREVCELKYGSAAVEQAVAVPVGHRIVPVEPTERMLECINGGYGNLIAYEKTRLMRIAKLCYSAILAAAPPLPSRDSVNLAACDRGRVTQPLTVGMHVTCPSAPERIWLQSDPECASDAPPKFPVDDEATWCRDRINKSDTLYIRADLVAAPAGEGA